jgi:hypothetical protein
MVLAIGGGIATCGQTDSIDDIKADLQKLQKQLEKMKRAEPATRYFVAVLRLGGPTGYDGVDATAAMNRWAEKGWEYVGPLAYVERDALMFVLLKARKP